MPAEPSCGTTTDTGGTGTGATTPGGGTGELDRDGLFPRLMGLATPGGACNVPFIIRIYVKEREREEREGRENENLMPRICC